MLDSVRWHRLTSCRDFPRALASRTGCRWPHLGFGIDGEIFWGSVSDEFPFTNRPDEEMSNINLNSKS